MNLDDLLAKIRVAQPCRVQWSTMEGSDAKRFCEHCEKHVYNFAEMSKAEIVELARGNKGKLCGRLYRRTDGTIVTRDCRPATSDVWSTVVKGVAASAIGASLLTGCSEPGLARVDQGSSSGTSSQGQETPPEPADPHRGLEPLQGEIVVTGDLEIPQIDECDTVDSNGDLILGTLLLPPAWSEQPDDSTDDKR